MSRPAGPAGPRLHYAWLAAGETFVTRLAAAGARATPGVMLLPLGNEFQWSRATVSSILSINIFLYGLIGPFAAALYQRFGLRRTMVAAMLLLGGGFALSTVATRYWQFVVLWGFVVGAGSGLAATVPPTVKLTGDVFGREKASIVFGWVVASHQVGAACAAYAAGVLRTGTGGYARAFVGAGVLCGIAAFVVLPIARQQNILAISSA
jgi:MFS family permease